MDSRAYKAQDIFDRKSLTTNALQSPRCKFMCLMLNLLWLSLLPWVAQAQTLSQSNKPAVAALLKSKSTDSAQAQTNSQGRKTEVPALLKPPKKRQFKVTMPSQSTPADSYKPGDPKEGVQVGFNDIPITAEPPSLEEMIQAIKRTHATPITEEPLSIRNVTAALRKMKASGTTEAAALLRESPKSPLKVTKKTIALQSAIHLGPEKIKMFVATGALQYYKLWLDYDGDPRRIAAVMETLTDLESNVGLYFFVLANGLTGNWLKKEAIFAGRKGNEILKTRILRSIPFVGPSAGMLASMIFHDASELFKDCALSRLKDVKGLTVAQRKEARADIKTKCSEVWRTFDSEQIAKRYVPTLVGLALGNAVLVGQSLGRAWAANKLREVALKPSQGLIVTGVKLFFDVAESGPVRFIVTKAHPIVTVGSLISFFILDDYITPPLTRGFSVILDSANFNRRRNNLDLAARNPLCASQGNDSSKERCFEELSEKILDWKGMHTSWRMNTNQEYEVGNSAYQTIMKRISTQFQVAKSYYTSFLNRSRLDQENDEKVKQGLIPAEVIAEFDPSILMRKFPFFGVLVSGAFLKKGLDVSDFESTSTIKSILSKLYVTQPSDIEVEQKRRVSVLSQIMFKGFSGYTNDDILEFLVVQFSLVDEYLKNRIAPKVIPWMLSHGYEVLKDGNAVDNYFWVKENVFSLEDPIKRDKTISFFKEVIAVAFNEESIYIKSGLDGHIKFSLNMVPAQEKELMRRLEEMKALLLSGDTDKMSDGLLRLNELTVGGKCPDTYILKHLAFIRALIGDPNPILISGMAYPYLYNLDPENKMVTDSEFYGIPKKYPFKFKSAVHYLTHEMICGQKEPLFTWDYGFDADFFPPRVVFENSAFGEFCKTSSKVFSPNTWSVAGAKQKVMLEDSYENQYITHLNLYSGVNERGVIPQILAGKEKSFAGVDAAKLLSFWDDEKAYNHAASIEQAKIGTWWESTSGVAYDGFLLRVEKHWINVYKKLQMALKRSNETQLRGFEALGWTDFINPIIEKLRVDDRYPFNLLQVIAIEWDAYMNIIVKLDKSPETATRVKAVTEVVQSMLKFLFEQAQVDFSTLVKKDKTEMIKKIDQLNKDFQAQLLPVKESLEKRLPQIAPALNSGFENVQMTMGGYMNAGVLAIYDPEGEGDRTIKEAAKKEELSGKPTKPSTGRSVNPLLKK
jgi:hypothetical protein